MIEISTYGKKEREKLFSQLALEQSNYAAARAELMKRRAEALKGLPAESMERYDTIAAFAAEQAALVSDFEQRVSVLKKMIARVYEDQYEQIASLEEDQELETSGQYFDGSLLSAANVAAEIISNLPQIPEECTFDFSLLNYKEKKLCLKAYNGKKEGNCFETVFLSMGMPPARQRTELADWETRVQKLYAWDDGNNNQHVAEPFGHLPDNVSEPSPTARKEAGNE